MGRGIFQKIFIEHGLGEISLIEKIEVGFTNEIFLVNSKYIVKVYGHEKGEESFLKEVFLYDFFKDNLPVPRVVVADDSRKICGSPFIIYPIIEGRNLYEMWHLFTDLEREDLIRQLCGYLKVINAVHIEELPEHFTENGKINWRKAIGDKIERSLEKLQIKKTLSDEFIDKIRFFVRENLSILDEQKMALVYWDAHFDNILVQDKKIVGILDFERTELASIDFTLDIVKRMQEYPKKYMSEESEKFCKAEDYRHLLEWFQEYYPELFDFKELETRLNIYVIAHILGNLIGWPKTLELKI